MEFTKYPNFSIDASDIWLYERNNYLAKRKADRNRNAIDDLYEFLQQFYLDAQHEPFIETSDKTAYAEIQREQCYNMGSAGAPPELFMCKGKVYKMSNPCEVNLNDYNQIEFQRLFILKLRQYFDGLIHLKDFLKYQLDHNFKNKSPEFQEFLRVSLIQYEGVIDGKIINVINDFFMWIRTADLKAPGNLNEETIITQEKKVSKHDALQIQDKVELQAIGTAANESIPDGYQPVSGNFTREETKEFFRFLYKEVSEEGKSFLLESEVTEMFKYGLAIPPAPPAQKYELNCSLKFPKSIVEFGIYKFFYYHTTSEHKKDILKFFANYLVDFEKVLKSEVDMRTWSSNVVGKRPSRMKFAIGEYLPERMKEGTGNSPQL
jgi:hypothetical protein